MRVFAGAVSFALVLGCAAAQGLAAPVRIEAAGAPIDVDVGHAAPYVVDWDGDGNRDLLVGQFGEGMLRVYRNTGSEAKPSFGAHEWFVAGGKPATIAAG